MKYIIIFISIVILSNCQNNNIDNTAFQVNPNLSYKKNELIAYFKRSNQGDTGEILNIILRQYPALKNVDTIQMDFSGGFFTGYHLTMKIICKKVEFKLTEYSCTYNAKFVIDTQTVILKNPSLEINDSIIGFINIIAHHDEKRTDWSGGKVIIKGYFSMKIRDINTNFDDVKREEVMNRIDTMNVQSTTFLDLSSCNLKEVPMNISKFTELEQLSLGRNNVESLDISPNYKKLKNLDLSNNQIKYISANIGKLTNLEELTLHNSPISELPNSFWNLTKLEHLELEGTNIKAISKDIANLKNLKFLGLSGVKLKKLPVEILQLKKLEEIYLPDNFNDKAIINGLKKNKVEVHQNLE